MFWLLEFGVVGFFWFSWLALAEWARGRAQDAWLFAFWALREELVLDQAARLRALEERLAFHERDTQPEIPVFEDEKSKPLWEVSYLGAATPAVNVRWRARGC